MPIKISDLVRDRRRLDLEWEGMSFFVEYAPSRMTGRTLDMAMAAASAGGTSNEMEVLEKVAAPFLADVIISWDLSVDDGTVYPITEDNIRALPFLFQLNVMVAINRDQAHGVEDERDPFPSSPSESSSPDGSPPEE
jgi:hypothetical protein